MSVNVWKNGIRAVHINEEGVVVGSVGSVLPTELINTENGWVDTGEHKVGPQSINLQPDNIHSKAKYDALLKVGISPDSAAQISGYTGV